jgi:ribosomal protein L11 methyltransferase
VKDYPALDVRTTSSDMLLAIVDDFGPIAAEERDDIVRVFFASSDARDAAHAAIASDFEVAAVDVPDEDWARRSQDSITPITVGRITVTPPWWPPASSGQIPNPESPVTIVILPSMGFGTGHHVTTRLCLAALQALDLTELTVLDVGTGSGVLALAADRLGAARAIGIDFDEDAIQSARDNLPLNPDAAHVSFETADLATTILPAADVITANLTGALLTRSAALLLASLKPGGHLIVSGLQSHERSDVVNACAPAAVQWEREEEGWVGLTMKKPWQSTAPVGIGSNT